MPRHRAVSSARRLKPAARVRIGEEVLGWLRPPARSDDDSSAGGRSRARPQRSHTNDGDASQGGASHGGSSHSGGPHGSGLHGGGRHSGSLHSGGPHGGGPHSGGLRGDGRHDGGRHGGGRHGASRHGASRHGAVARSAPPPSAATPWTPPSWTGDEWAAARFAVQVHGIGPLLHTRLEGVRTSDARAYAFFSYLAHCEEMNTLRHALWQEELEGILLEAGRAGVPLLALKEAVLPPFFWEDPTRRPTGDIDLLARPSDRAATEAACARRGWQHLGDSSPPRRYYLARLGLDALDEVGEHPDQPLRLEIHEHAVQLFFDLRHDMTEVLWRDARRMRVGEAPIMVPATETTFEHVLLHTGFDLANRLTRFVALEDLRLMAATLPERAWETLLARARAAQLERFYLAPLIMAERYTRDEDGPFLAPPFVTEALQAATPPALVAWLRRTPLSAFTACGSQGALATNAWWRLRWFPAGRERLARARRLLAPSEVERRSEFVLAGAPPGLWAYYRAQLSRWRR